MGLDRIVETVGLDCERIDAQTILFRKDFAFFQLTDSAIAYQTSRPLLSRHYYNILAKSFPSNRFILGFHDILHERSLLELKKMEKKQEELYLSQRYSSEESPFIVELLQKYLMSTIA